MKSIWKPWFAAIAVYGIALLFSWHYVMALNAATSSGETAIYSGRIERKWINHSRFGDEYGIDVLDSTSSQIITLTVSRLKYASLREGDAFRTEFIRGGFGIPYRWRFGLFSHK